MILGFFNFLIGEPRVELGPPAPKAGVLPLYYSPPKFRKFSFCYILVLHNLKSTFLCDFTIAFSILGVLKYKNE